MTNNHEIKAEKKGVQYLLCVTEYLGQLLDFQICARFDGQWCEVCPPYPFNRSEINEYLQDELNELQDCEGYQSAAAEATADFQRDQRY
jgi:Zn-finger protein